MLGQYQIIDQIGGGGMGMVYRAYDPTTDREVAIKVLPPQLMMEPEFLARFQNEGKVIARLEHPHILPLYAVGEDGGVPYLVMRFVTGGSLQDRMAEARSDPDFLARTITQVADALEEAHRRNIVHRDVKPGNILLDHGDNAYLADFGIAKMLESSQYLSMSGGGIGTPAYMPPEQWRGKKLDGRADIYALGCMVFRIVTGSPPYEAETRDGMMTEHLMSPVPSARERNRRVSPALDALLRRAMAKIPQDRPSTAREFALDLAAALSGAGTAPRPEPPPPEPPKRKTPTPAPPKPIGQTATGSRAPIGVVIAVAVIVLIVGVLAASGVFAAHGQPQVAGVISPTDKPAPTNVPQATPAPTELPINTPIPSTTPVLVGFPGNPVTANNQWTPVKQTFDGVEMLLVPAGCFMMGSNDGGADEKPVHQVCFDKPFWMDLTEVTNGQFAQLGGQAGRSSYFTGDNRPREQITWTEADDFCRKRGARLPSEAEWEYAARGPDSLTYPWGDAFVGDNAVWNTSQTADVGSKPQGAAWVGALDMSGNVWEWVNDWYDPSTYGTLSQPATNPQGPGNGQYRALRGGSWDFTGTDFLRAATRSRLTPVNGYSSNGFRCARSY
jgi:serine/threonine-protein kinase